MTMVACNDQIIDNGDDEENYDNIVYRYDDEAISSPFWQTNVIYQETILLVKDDETGEISGNLQFEPKKILGVKDFKLTTDYQLNEDYTIVGNKVIRTENSKMPYLTSSNLSGQELPAGFILKEGISNVLTDCVMMAGSIYTESPFYYGHQIQVSYAFSKKDIKDDLGSYASYRLDELQHVKTKLINKEPLKIVGIGDSVLEGCSSSKKFNHEPFLDNFFDLTVQNLARKYETEVNGVNLSVGGKKSAWGAASTQINAITSQNPDLLIIHFGINDLGDNVSPSSYIDNIESIILNVRLTSPNCDFILLSPFAPNETIYDLFRGQDYVDRLKGLETSHSDVILVDVLNTSLHISKNKKYFDLTANGINHVNDYASRIYLSSLLATLYKK